MGGTSQFTMSMNMFGKDPACLSDDENDPGTVASRKQEQHPSESNERSSDFPLQQTKP